MQYILSLQPRRKLVRRLQRQDDATREFELSLGFEHELLTVVKPVTVLHNDFRFWKATRATDDHSAGSLLLAHAGPPP